MRVPLDLADEAVELVAWVGGRAGPGCVGRCGVEVVEVEDAEVLVGGAGKEMRRTERGEGGREGED